MKRTGHRWHMQETSQDILGAQVEAIYHHVVSTTFLPYLDYVIHVGINTSNLDDVREASTDALGKSRPLALALFYQIFEMSGDLVVEQAFTCVEASMRSIQAFDVLREQVGLLDGRGVACKYFENLLVLAAAHHTRPALFEAILTKDTLMRLFTKVITLLERLRPWSHASGEEAQILRLMHLDMFGSTIQDSSSALDASPETST